MKAFALNLFKNALGAFLGQLVGLPLLDAHVDTWKKAAAAAIGAVIIGLYNWTNPNDPRFGVK